MDFWARLLNPLSAGTPRKEVVVDPAKRLHRFEKDYNSLLVTWRTSTNLSKDSEAAEILELRLQELTNILNDETRRPLPHPCIQFASIKQIYVPIGKIATSSYNEWIIKEAVLFFATLIESEEEAFVENPTFSTSLTNLLVRITGINSVRLGLDTESKVVELAFNITTKIRLSPEILPAWFKTFPDDSPRGGKDLSGRERFAGRTQRADFPLFYILMDYIHHEGKIGDFARTGLLYIIEAASRSVALEQWIVESDLATLMATGLGALYSQLSRKLVIDHLPHDLPPILAFSDYEHPNSTFEAVSSCSSEFQSHLETFLSHLLFWQDVLNHCRSVEVKSTLLEHFQVIFLQQLLYPSLLESSDIDGGSSVAVLTYLRRILESLDHPDMINLILHYLLDLPDIIPAQKPTKRTSINEARQRKSMDLASLMEKSNVTATPLLFNLVDLILACLRSHNQQTIHVTLQLVSAIVKRHHRYAVITLLKTEILPSNSPSRTVGAHDQEIEYLICLASAFGSQDQFDETYDNVLKDTMARLESHPCSLKLISPQISMNLPQSLRAASSLSAAPRDIREHTLRPDDPMLNAIMDIMETFFINPVETNLSVTETLVNLAVCGYMSVEGWLTRHPDKYQYGKDENDLGEAASQSSASSTSGDHLTLASLLGEEPEVPLVDDEAELLEKMEYCRKRPEWAPSSLPRLLHVLKQLSDQVTSYKGSIPRFEELIQQRWEAFQTADTMLDQPLPVRRSTPAQVPPLDHPGFDERSRSGSPSRASTFEGLASRLLSELGTPSRSSSPSGRRIQGPSSGSVTPGGIVTSPKALPAIPKDLPPLPSDLLRPSTSRTQSPSNFRDDLVRPQPMRNSSQVAAFAAIDQSILSRKVGLPEPKFEPVPLDYGKRRVLVPEDVDSDSTESEEESDSDAESSSDEAQSSMMQKIRTPKKQPKAASTSQATTESSEVASDSESESESERKSGHGESEADTASAATTSLAAVSTYAPTATTQPTSPTSPSPIKTDQRGRTKVKVPGSDSGSSTTSTDRTSVSVSHVVTNVIIYQSFLFELASLMQVRASLFDEVRYV